MSGPVFIKHLKSNVYVTLNAIGSFQCNLCSHWLIQIFCYLSFFMNTGPVLFLEKQYNTLVHSSLVTVIWAPKMLSDIFL